MYFLVSVVLRTIFIITGFCTFLHGLYLLMRHEADFDSFGFMIIGLFFFYSGCFFDWNYVASFLTKEV